MSAKDPRKSFCAALPTDLAAALRAHRRRIGARSLSAAARDALRRPDRARSLADAAAPAPREKDLGRGGAPRTLRLRLQLEPDLQARLGLVPGQPPHAIEARLVALLRRALPPRAGAA